MKSAIIFLCAASAIGCANSAQTVQNTANAPAATPKAEKLDTMAAHTTENQSPPVVKNAPGQPSRPQSGDPIDTTQLDSDVMAAEKALNGKPADGVAKKALATAYLKRATALTEARQYASALGDYRRTLKYDPANPEAKQWIDQIVTIYDSMGRPSPKEGEEPPPLPFKKT